MTPVELTTARLLLNQPGECDVDTITEHCQDPLFERFVTTPWPYRREHAEGFVRDYVPTGWASDEECTWAIRGAAGSADREGKLLGVIGWVRRHSMIGYWLGAPHRRRGIMSDAVTAVVDWVFREGHADAVGWECVTGNDASARTARTAGFTFTGIAPLSMPLRDGRTRPEGWHAVLVATDDRSIKQGWPV